MGYLHSENKYFFLHRYKSIVKKGESYILQSPYYESEDGGIEETEESVNNPNQNAMLKNCNICIYNNNNCCEIRANLENLDPHHFIPVGWNHNCDAYVPIQKLTMIRSKDEMIKFIEQTENFFGCPEDYERFYGLERRWDEETGKIQETTREYYNRGGCFKNIPDKYPCVIYFHMRWRRDPCMFMEYVTNQKLPLYQRLYLKNLWIILKLKCRFQRGV